MKIEVLEGVEAIRRRPGMYIGDVGEDGLHHLLWEVVDNACDEVIAGRASRVEVEVKRDGSVSVWDDGGGIPDEPISEGVHAGTSSLEAVFTLLHSGGKFGDEYGGPTGGLHGVGLCAVNALSEWCEVATRPKGGGAAWLRFERGRLVRRHGRPGGWSSGWRSRMSTRVSFKPDPSIFGEASFDGRRILDRLQEKAALVGALVGFSVEGEERVEIRPSSLVQLAREKAARSGEGCKVLVAGGRVDGFEVAVGLVEDGGLVCSWVNGVPTTDGGVHVDGARSGLLSAVNERARRSRLLSRGDEDLRWEDVGPSMVVLVSGFLRDPVFAGQTKSRLASSAARRPAAGAAVAAFENLPPQKVTSWLRTVVARVREKEEAKAEKAARRTRTTPPVEKLKDCRAKGERAELFLVEGDSAGGTAVDARNPDFQAVLPLRGKILNAEKASTSKVMENTELRSLVQAVGAGVGGSFDVNRMRYGKIVVLCDADVDGLHIRALLLSFFFRFMRPALEAGRIWVAEPPLYTAGGRFYHTFPTGVKGPVTRLKGLGEMNWEELRDTVMSPDGRKLVKVGVADAEAADTVIRELMGQGGADKRALLWQDGAESHLPTGDDEATVTV